MKLFYLTSGLHDEASVNAHSEAFIKGIEDAMDSRFEICNDFFTK